jgi:hypothetical protein
MSFDSDEPLKAVVLTPDAAGKQAEVADLNRLGTTWHIPLRSASAS